MRQPRILIIESDEPSRTALVSHLGDAGCVVTTASNNLKALNELLENSPDLILTADSLPSGNGEELCLLLRQTCHVPIIVMGRHDERAAVKMLDVGADVYMDKPLDTTELIARVRSMLRRKMGT